MRFVYLLSALLIASASAFAPQSAARSIGVAMNAAKQSDEVVNFKKPEFVASVSEKTGLSKTESEAALAAVLETIQEGSEGNISDISWSSLNIEIYVWKLLVA